MTVSFKMQLPPMHWLDGTAVEQEAVQAIVDGDEESEIVAFCEESGMFVIQAMGALIVINEDYVDQGMTRLKQPVAEINFADYGKVDPDTKTLQDMTVEEFQSDFNEQVMKSGSKPANWFYNL